MGLQERFDAKYIPEPNSGCWLWDGACDGQYGVINVGQRGFTNKAHRVSWRLHRGPIPDGMHVCHKCDVRCCVNPGHLFLGTRQDNMDDMKRKGRQPKPKNPVTRRKLSDRDVVCVRNDPRPQKDIAAAYGIGERHVRKIKTLAVWPQLP